MGREDRLRAYLEAYDAAGQVALPAIDLSATTTMAEAEVFALSAAANALGALLDALVVLHRLAEPEED